MDSVRNEAVPGGRVEELVLGYLHRKTAFFCTADLMFCEGVGGGGCLKGRRMKVEG